MKTVWNHSSTHTDLRLIQPSIVKNSVELLNNFSKSMYSLSKNYNLNEEESKELFDKVTKGNEGLVANFLNSNKKTLNRISKTLGVKIKSFALTYDHHGTDGYFITDTNEYISVELKTTSAHIIPANKQQSRKTKTNNNLLYKAGFKYHFTDDKKEKAEDKFADFNKELKNYRDRKQVTIFAGILDSEGVKSVADIFFLTTQQSIDVLNWYKSNRKFNGYYASFDPSSLFEGNKLSGYCTHVYSKDDV